jgi:hypothetical protein
MKTAGRENPNRWVTVPSTRARGAAVQNRSRSIQWAAKQEKLQPQEMCFFLTSTFIELHRQWRGILSLLRLFFAATGQLLDPTSETYSIADRKAYCGRIIKMTK